MCGLNILPCPDVQDSSVIPTLISSLENPKAPSSGHPSAAGAMLHACGALPATMVVGAPSGSRSLADLHEGGGKPNFASVPSSKCKIGTAIGWFAFQLLYPHRNCFPRLIKRSEKECGICLLKCPFFPQSHSKAIFGVWDGDAATGPCRRRGDQVGGPLLCPRGAWTFGVALSLSE